MTMKLVAPIAALALASCVSTSLPEYDDVGIRLSGTLTGKLGFSEGCYKISSENQNIVYLILPQGTRKSADSLVFRSQNGGQTVAVGQQVVARGGYMKITDDEGDPYRKASCRGDAFIVNSLETTNG